MYLKAYEDIKEARTSIAEWIRFYNFERQHQSLGYSTPWEIYQDNEKGEQVVDYTVSSVVSLGKDTTPAETILVY